MLSLRVLVPFAMIGAMAGATLSLSAQAPVGISRELAQERAANVSDVRYSLSYALIPQAPDIEASETLRFELKSAAQPLLLDFRDGRISGLTLNGKMIPPLGQNGHLLLSPPDLHKGENKLEIQFSANVATAEKAITRFQDKDDGSEYLYTLFVPMDASMAFPCFDQPDLKGRFSLEVTAPVDWTVISNTPVVKTEALKTTLPTTPGLPTTPALRQLRNKGTPTGQQRITFAETPPISTYLFAFAAGPFVKVHPVDGLPGFYVRKSKAAAAVSEAPELQQTAADGITAMASYFAQPLPFPKYDMVLIPGFAYGGMEHAGATFLREESVLFRSAPTATDLVNRDILVLHELAHQWFGDSTTMRWFDDLWLKEGFAQYMAYRMLAQMRPQDDIWKRFYEAIKPDAYAIDETQGTTPIYQEIPNLADAKSAYGAIVYSKAPGVLKQLAFVLGDDNFRKGVDLYLAQHRYGNAQWSDLIAAFESVSGQSLETWAAMWIKHRGMPEVEAQWSCAGGNIESFTLTQHDVLGSSDLWPIATEIALGYPDRADHTLRAQLDTQQAAVAAVKGQPCPAYVFANNHDFAYGLFPLDQESRSYLMHQIGAIHDPFERTLLWGSLWQSVRFAVFAPGDYLQMALAQLPAERDEALSASIVGHAEWAIHRDLSQQAQDQFTAGLERLAADRMVNDENKDLRIVWFRALPGLAQQAPGRAVLKSILRGDLKVPGVELRQQDRWRLVTALIAYGDPEADVFLKAEQTSDATGEGQKFAYIAQAAQADPNAKQLYFIEYLHNTERPEDWIEGSLGAFNYWNQSTLTAPFLEPALRALPQIKADRKIFFLVDWLDAFIGGQQSAAAAEQVHDYLRQSTIDPDLRLKILEAVDELDRTVAIRRKFVAAP
jgi:aminopeptidase N